MNSEAKPSFILDNNRCEAKIRVGLGEGKRSIWQENDVEGRRDLRYNAFMLINRAV